MNDIQDTNWHALSDEAIVRRVGDFVKWARLQQNKSQQTVAEDAGISPKSFRTGRNWDWED
jgi:hypothetical protein